MRILSKSIEMTYVSQLMDNVSQPSTASLPIGGPCRVMAIDRFAGPLSQDWAMVGSTVKYGQAWMILVELLACHRRSDRRAAPRAWI